MTAEINRTDHITAKAEGDYGRVRRRAWFRDVVARLAGRSNQVLSYEAVRQSLELGGPIYRGVKTVAVAQIVGSVDRYRDFDDVFLPKQDGTANRWKSIARAFYSDVDLPPVRLYKVGSAYFVMDGHYRVSVAREQGIEFIDGEVQEVISRVPISANLKAEDLRILHEYRRFLERTGGAGLPSNLDSSQQSVRAGAWLFDRIQATPRLRVDPGLRVDWNGVAGETLLSPRVSARFDLGRGYALRASAGYFTQSPGSEKLLQSHYFVDLTDARALSLTSERSIHLLGALEREFSPGFVARVEGYYKTFDRMIVGRLETPAETAARVSLYDFPADLQSSLPAAPQIVSEPVNAGDGSAYGFDVYVSRQPRSASERFSGWGSYTWGRAAL